VKVEAIHVGKVRGDELFAVDSVRAVAGKGLELLVGGAPNLGDDPRGDVDGQRDWWAT